jgi:hypothetical protein
MTPHRAGTDLWLVTGVRAASDGARPAVAVYRSGLRLFVIDLCGNQGLRSETMAALDQLGTASPAADPICLDRSGHTIRWGGRDAPAVTGGGGRTQHQQTPHPHNIELGGTRWVGHTLRGNDGASDLHALLAGPEPGQAAVFHLPRIRTMLLGELAGKAAWIENPERSASVIRRTLAMLDTGDVDRVYGEAPRLDLGLCGDEARAALLTMLPGREP